MAEKRFIPGSFCWYELHSKDTAACEAFYTRLLGWTTNKMDMGPEGSYTVWMQGEAGIGGMEALKPGRGDHSFWLPYITVEDVDAHAARVKDLGGELLVPPTDFPDVGRFAVFSDSQGAYLAMISLKDDSKPDTALAGSFCWCEAMVKDLDAAQGFYTKLFGWQTKSMDMGEHGTYTMWAVGDAEQGGMMKIEAEWGDVPPHWMAYIAVEDVDRDLERVKELGGSICVPPTDVPGVGRFIVINDPAGAMISLITLTEGEGK